MRVSDSMNYANTKLAIGKNRSEMSDLQTQAASQKSVNKPSDDPVGTTKLLSSRTESKGIEQYTKNLDIAGEFLNFTDQSLDEVTQIFMRAKELALSQANDPSASELSRKAVAQEVRQLYNQALQVANRKLGNRFIFGGYDTTQKPFSDDGTYRGDRGDIMIEINKGSYLSMNLPGDMVFLGRDAKKSGVQDISSEQDNLPQLQKREIESRQGEEVQSIRGPAGELLKSEFSKEEYKVFYEGENIFKVLSDLEIGLNSNDKYTIQDAIERTDGAMEQVINARAKVGSRVMNLATTMDSLQKSKVDEKAKQSNIEDVDAYELFSKLSQNESTLQATMSTSAKILQRSLLDFLR